MHQVKTDLRIRLNTSTVCKIMRIVLEGGELENFRFVKAAEIWSEMRHRRISIKLVHVLAFTCIPEV